MNQGLEPKSVCDPGHYATSLRIILQIYPKQWSDLPKVTQLIGTKTEIQIYSSPSHALCMIPCCLLQSHKISFCLGVPTLGPEPTVVPAHRLLAWNHAWLFSAPSPGSWVPESVLAGVTPVHGQIFPKEDKSLLGSKECKQDFPLQTHRPLKMRSKLPHPFGCYVGSLWLPCS